MAIGICIRTRDRHRSRQSTGSPWARGSPDRPPSAASGSIRPYTGSPGQAKGYLGNDSLAGASTDLATSEENTTIVNLGGYLQQQIAWRNVLYVTVAGRLDGNSAFGVNSNTAFYPSGSISYVMSDESYWPKNDVVSSFRLQLAGGQSGREPTFRLAQGSFTSAAYLLNGDSNQTGLIAKTLGNADLKPELSTEYKAGLDAGLLRGRFTLGITAYDRAAHQLIFDVPLDISTGVPGIKTENLGEIDNRGLEASLSGTIFTTRLVSLDLALTAAIQRSREVSQGNLPPTPISDGVTGAVIQEDTFGRPIGEYYAIPYTFRDINHDGVIEPNEIAYGSKPVAIGEPGPRDDWSVSPTVHLFSHFRVNALLDRRDGITVYNGGDAFRCLGSFQLGRDCNDPHA